MNKVYCNDCKHSEKGYTSLHNIEVYFCIHPDNIVKEKIGEDYWSVNEQIRYIQFPNKKNEDNDCKDFEEK